jgi:hypothetical protein
MADKKSVSKILAEASAAGAADAAKRGEISVKDAQWWADRAKNTK